MERTTKNTKVSVFLLFFFLLIIPLATSLPSGGLYEGLRIHYDFEDYNSVHINNTHNATLNTLKMLNLSFWDGGFSGYGITPSKNSGTPINQTNGIVTGQSINALDNFSFSVWVNPKEFLTSKLPITSFVGGSTPGSYVQQYFSLYPVTSNSAFPAYNMVNGSYSHINKVATTNAITTNEWSFLAVTVDVSEQTVNFYVNGVLATTSNLSGVSGQNWGYVGSIFGTGKSGQEDFFNGTIDSYSFWQNRILSLSDVETLYNDGNGLSYDSYGGVAPSQIANIADQYIAFSAIKDLYMGDFFVNYTDVSVYFEDYIGSASVIVTTDFDGAIDSYETTYLKVYLTPIGENVRLRIVSNLTQMTLSPMTIIVNNAIGSVQDTFNVIINGTPASFPPPDQIFSPEPSVTYCENTNTSRSFSGWFENYNSVTVSYYDSELATTTTINTTKASATSMSVNADHINVSITPYASNIILRIENGGTDFTTNMNITAFNDYGSTSLNFTYTISTTCTGSTARPILFNQPGMINLEAGEVYNLDFSDYFTGQKWFYVTTYYDSVTNQLAGYDEFDTLYYTLQMTDEGFTITSKTTAFQESFTLYAVNEYGSVWYTQTFNMAESLSTGGETGRGIMDSVLGFLPNAESLTMKERYGYVLVTILVTLLLVIILNFEMKSESGSSSSIFIVLGGVLALLEIIFFVAIGYIPIVIIVILALVGGLIAFMLLKGSGAQGG